MMKKAIHVAHNILHPVYYGSVAVWGSAPYNYAAGGLCLLTLYLVFIHAIPSDLEDLPHDEA